MKLENENAEMTTRWMKKVAEDAEKMNAANTMYEEVYQQRAALEKINSTAPENISSAKRMRLYSTHNINHFVQL